MDDLKKNSKISDEQLNEVSGGSVRIRAFCPACGKAISNTSMMENNGLCPTCYHNSQGSLFNPGRK